MGTTIDIDALAAPIAGELPTGTDARDDVRFDSPYQALKSLREEAMATERAIQQGSDGGGGDYSAARGKWLDVVQAAEAILGTESKDLEVCALLIEGLVRTDGVAGVRDGYRLTARLVAAFWEELHPRLDPDDPDSLEDRIAAFSGLDGGGQPGTLARFIPLLRITNCGAEDFAAYQLDQVFSQQASGGDGGGSLEFSLDDVKSAAQKTALQFYVDLSEALEEAEVARAELDQQFTERCGFDAPSTGRTREALEKLSANVRLLAGDRIAAAEAEAEASGREGDSAPAPEADGDTAAGAAGAPRGGAAAPSGVIQNRADAIGRLRKVAEWFREYEPHSPLSYSLENLVRWAHMPLDRLIEEWIQDESALERYRLMTGMPARDGSGDS